MFILCLYVHVFLEDLIFNDYIVFAWSGVVYGLSLFELIYVLILILL